MRNLARAQESGTDWTADTAGLGYKWAAIIFGSLLLLIAAVYYWTRISRTILFWAAFVLTRPLGAVVGDFLDKPIEKGGLALSRYGASAVLLRPHDALHRVLPAEACGSRPLVANN